METTAQDKAVLLLEDGTVFHGFAMESEEPPPEKYALIPA
jgi:hypothetical protein